VPPLASSLHHHDELLRGVAVKPAAARGPTPPSWWHVDLGELSPAAHRYLLGNDRPSWADRGTKTCRPGKRLQAAYDSRDRFGDSVLDILALCANLEKAHVQSGIKDPLRSRLQDERDRWLGQIDETTTWLVDHWQRFVLGYLGRRDVRNLLVRYVADARGLWLSDRPLEERVRMLKELTEHIQTIYFERRWRVLTAVPQEISHLRMKLDILEGNAPPTSLASDP